MSIWLIGMKEVIQFFPQNHRTQQRIKNNLKDMSHTHLLESRLKPEMVVKPSALWQHRSVSGDTFARFFFAHM